MLRKSEKSIISSKIEKVRTIDTSSSVENFAQPEKLVRDFAKWAGCFDFETFAFINCDMEKFHFVSNANISVKTTSEIAGPLETTTSFDF